MTRCLDWDERTNVRNILNCIGLHLAIYSRIRAGNPCGESWLLGLQWQRKSYWQCYLRHHIDLGRSIGVQARGC